MATDPLDPLKNTRSHVLIAAGRAVNGARQRNYGPPERNFERVRDLWNTYLRSLGVTNPDSPSGLMTSDIAVMLAMVKIARLIETPSHFESWVDLAGYAACGAEASGAADPASPVTQPATPEPNSANMELDNERL